ncbi:MAG: DNA gyrase inhibitor YacG [Endozoicomonadaceae bacterium]|nr:DNA gyrase inhibitor YacG [Endozoicomonadaceae bacterium]
MASFESSETAFILQCPNCKTSVVFSAENIYRPFCTQRCRSIDLGLWTSGSYAIPDVLEDSEQNNLQ